MRPALHSFETRSDDTTGEATAMTTITPDDVLDYWFDHAAPSVMAHVSRWFQGGPEVDADIRARFGDAVHAALAGAFDAWADTPRGRLALVILLDQFTRNVFRDDPRTYAGDPKARALVRDAFDRGLDAGLGFTERIFLSMPLLHSEELADHERLAALSGSLTGDPPPGWEQFAAMNREQTLKYHDIISRFGRFPHRNALLGRAPTAEEDAFMADWAARAKPSGLSQGQ